MTLRRWIALTLLPALLFVAPQIVFGQAQTAGELSGTVTDPSGAVIPGAGVVLSRPSTGFSRTVVANASGEFDFPDLQAGQYILNVNANGFQVAKYSDVEVQTGRQLNLNVHMKIGSSTQTVEISSGIEALETTTNTLSTTITPDAVQD